MDATDAILLLIAGLIAAGIWVFVRESRQRSKDTELMRSALYATTQRDTRISDPVPVTFDKSTNNALRRFQQVAVDLQGIIELASRYMVSQVPPSIIDDMKVPDDWTRASEDQTAKR